MSESLGHRKKDWDFSSTLKTLLDRHTLELSNEELEEINLYRTWSQTIAEVKL